jgi:hypothetical protein
MTKAFVAATLSGANRVFSWLAKPFAVLAIAVLAGCGGGGSGGPDPSPVASPGPQPAPPANVLTMTVDRGPDSAAFNSPFVNVTVCRPGTAICQTVDHVLVDTGSFGLRLAAGALDPGLLLPAVASATGTPVAECAHFASGYAWGSVRRADIKLAGETAANLPLQVIQDPAAPYAVVPTVCSSTGPNFGIDTSTKGILGVGTFNQDCPACASTAAPNVYFSCPDGACSSTTLPLESQVANPVPAFAVDNNGVALTLPKVPSGGVGTLTGSLIFGIGTQANNQLGSATVFTTNSRGNFTTIYKGTTYSSSFIDSGSNGIFFNDSGIPQCSGFYCPEASLSLSAVNVSSTGVSGAVDFTVESVRSIAAGVAAANVGGNINEGGSFDWGLPFFFGRTVFVAVAGASTPGGAGPFWAY